MWFNQDDQQKGTVSDQRLREIVDQIILKVSPTETNQAELEQKASHLIASIQKHFTYKRQEIRNLDGFHYNPELIKMQNQMKFFHACHVANLELLEFEGLMQQIKEDIQNKAMQQHRLSTEQLREHASQLEAHNQRLIEQAQQMEMQMMLERLELHERMLKDLMNYQNHLDNQLKQLAAELLQSRQQTAQTVKRELGNIPELKQLNETQLDKLTNGLVLLEETKAVKLASIEKQIEEAKATAGQRKPAQSGQGGLLFRQQEGNGPQVMRLEAQKAKILSDYKHKKQQLYDSVGVSREQAAKIEGHLQVQNVLSQHSQNAVTIHQKSEIIKQKKAELAIKIEQEENLIRSQKEVLNRIHYPEKMSVPEYEVSLNADSNLNGPATQSPLDEPDAMFEDTLDLSAFGMDGKDNPDLPSDFDVDNFMLDGFDALNPDGEEISISTPSNETQTSRISLK